jgi:cell division protein FtsN
MRHLLSVVFIAFLVLTPSCKFFGGKAKKEKELSVLLARQDSIRVADSLRRVQERMMALENAKLDSIRLAEEEIIANESRYNIIVGSFITPQYAKDLQAEYIKQGYNAQILKVAGSRFELVAAEGHKSFRTAVDRLKQFQDTIQLDTWMYIKK